jgi:hypothetical protein
VEAAILEAMTDRSTAHAQRGRLPARHDSVPAGGERRDRRVDPTRSTFGPTIGLNVERARHAPDPDDRIVSPDPLIDASL